MPVPGHPPATCPHPWASADDLKIRFLGGSTIQIPATPLPDPGDQVAKLLGLVSAALAPLMPFFDLLDAVMGVPKVFEAVKSLNPKAIGDALSELMKLIDKLKQLLPPVSAPLMVKDIVHALRIYVDDLRRQVAAIVAQQSRIQAAAEKVPGAPGLAEHLLCAQETVDVAFQSMKTGGAPVNRIIRVVNLVGAVAGLPALPSLDLGADPAAAVAPLTSLSAALQAIEDAIPG